MLVATVTGIAAFQ